MRASFVLAACAVACLPPTEARVGNARLVDADGVVPEVAGALRLEIPGGDESAIPDGAPVGLAVDREVKFGTVRALASRLRARGIEPSYLVGRRNRVVVLRPFAAFSEPSAATVMVSAHADGRACVHSPLADEGRCTDGKILKHISGAHVRELVREAKKVWGVEHAHVRIDDDVEWGDAVRTIDGARTCCFDGDLPVSVRGLQDAPPTDGLRLLP